MPQQVKAQSPQSLQLAIEHLNRGEVIALPTDTVYGVGCLAFNAQAVAEIYRVKERPADKPIPVFVASLDALGQVCTDVPPGALPLLKKYWPGGLTAVLPAHPDLPGIVTNNGPTVAVRIPNHPAVLALLKELKQPLAVTSANLSGQPTPITAEGVAQQLQNRVPLVLDDGPSPGQTPSTIVDFTSQPPKILRQGAISLTEEDLL